MIFALTSATNLIITCKFFQDTQSFSLTISFSCNTEFGALFPQICTSSLCNQRTKPVSIVILHSEEAAIPSRTDWNGWHNCRHIFAFQIIQIPFFCPPALKNCCEKRRTKLSTLISGYRKASPRRFIT